MFINSIFHHQFNLNMQFWDDNKIKLRVVGFHFKNIETTNSRLNYFIRTRLIANYSIRKFSFEPDEDFFSCKILDIASHTKIKKIPSL